MALVAPRSPFEAGSLALPTPDFDMAEAERVANEDTPEKSLVDALLRGMRRLQITASQPAHVRPTVWSPPVDLSAEVTLPGAISVYVPVVTIIVPKGYGCRIEQYGMTVTDPAYTYNGTLLWAFRKNETGYLDMGLTDITQQRGSMVFPRKTVITLAAEDRLDFCIRRAIAAGGALTVQMGFRGWLWRMRNTNVGTQAAATAY